VRSQCLNARLIDVIDALRSMVAILDESCILEYPQMLRYRGAAERKSLGQLDHRQGSAREALQDRESGRITDCVQAGSKVSRHLR
jgi:hypothetical protein